MFSLIVPLYNEQQTLPQLTQRLAPVIDQLDFQHIEILLINDGSHDNTEQLITDITQQDPRYVGIHLARNFGHQAAVSIGLQNANGSVVGIIDGDLQDPPEILLRMVEALDPQSQTIPANETTQSHTHTNGNGNADVAYGVRTKRKENIFKRFAYAAFYRLLDSVSSTRIPLDSGDFCCMKRCVVDAMLQLTERNRFVRGLRAWVGFNQTPVTYERAARFAGEPKYTFTKLLALAYDGLFSFSTLPVRLMQLLGFFISTSSIFIAMAYATIYIFAAPGTLPTGWPTLVVSIWFLGGIQLLFMGLVGEYVVRTFDETRARPTAIIKRIDAFDQHHSLNTSITEHLDANRIRPTLRHAV